MSASVECNIEQNLFSKKLPTIRFLLAGVPVLITQQLDVDLVGTLSATAAGTVGFTAEAEAFVGMVYRDGQWDRESSINLDAGPTATGDVQISLTLSLPKIAYTAKAYGIVGVEVSLAVELKLTYFLPPADKYLSLTAAVKVGAAATITLDLKVVDFQFGFTFLDVTVFGPIEIWAKRNPSTDCASVTQIPESECLALLDIWQAGDGNGWNTFGATQWGFDDEPCGWVGVVCSGGRVTELRLTSRNVTGAIAPEISDLPELQVIEMINNSIDTIPSEIAELSKLQTLSLGTNLLESVPSAIGDLPALRDLSLNGNQLTSLPPAIGQLSTLETLRVAFNDLTSVPSFVADLDNLLWLDLRANDIGVLPPALFALPALGALEVSQNPLGAMPTAIGDLAALEWLDWGNNDLASVPTEVGQLHQLQMLKLDGNQLTSLPTSVGTLTALERLVLVGNQLVHVPAAVAQLSGLTHLEMSVNPWATDATSILSAVKANNPGLLVLSLGALGCPAITDATVVAWVETFDSSWDNGC